MENKIKNKERTNTVFEDINDKLSTYLGKDFAEYRNRWKQIGKNNIPSFPIHLDFELIDSCNMSCSFCARNEETHPNLDYEINSGKKLSESHFEKIIDEIKDEPLKSINFAFGEPLLYKNIFTIINRFHNVGVVDSIVITNGLLLDTYIDEIFTSGLTKLYVSLDAFSESTYKKVRGNGYEKIITNLLKVIEEKKKRNSKLPMIRVSFVETRINKHEKEQFVEFWKNKVDAIDLQTYINFANEKVTGNNEKQWNCLDPFRRMAITGNGEILPCCTFFGKKLAIGNINDSSIKDVWNGKEMKKVRDDLVNNTSNVCMICQGS